MEPVKKRETAMNIANTALATHGFHPPPDSSQSTMPTTIPTTSLADISSQGRNIGQSGEAINHNLVSQKFKKITPSKSFKIGYVANAKKDLGTNVVVFGVSRRSSSDEESLAKGKDKLIYYRADRFSTEFNTPELYNKFGVSVGSRAK